MERLKFIWQNKAVERGERMKWLRYELIEAVAVSRGNATDKWKESNDWFDPEGAPL